MAAPPPAAVPSRMPRVVREFFETEAAGGMVLLIAAVVALVWVNSPLRDSYEALWHTELSLHLGTLHIAEDLRHWVNDALMAIFFFVVGLEIKRELVVGQLQSWRRAALPAIAAIGGMVVPAAVYLMFNPAGPGSRGWGIPMATDIAFAIGVLALLGSRVAPGLKLFLLTLAIVDDIGAIVVIAIFYAASVEWEALLVAGLLVGTIVLLRRAGVMWMPAYVLLGSAVWLAVFESGVHATIAGVVLGLLAPARPMNPADVAHEWAETLSDDPDPAQTAAMTQLAQSTVSVAERLEYRLHPYTSLLIVPVFALANAGVVFDASSLTGSTHLRVAAGVTFGLVVGKLVGVIAGSWIALRTRVGALPEGVGWAQISGAAGLAGIGFTVSLFVTDLAFDDAGLQAAAKVGVLSASALASMVGAAILILCRGASAGAAERPEPVIAGPPPA